MVGRRVSRQVETPLTSGMYYLRTRPATNAIKFTVDVEALLKDACEGFELKHFNSNMQRDNSKDEFPKEEAAKSSILGPEGKENIDLNILQAQTKTDTEDKSMEKRAPLKACPLRRKKKTAEGTYEDDDECLACGS
jgi:hypothetical protein